MRPSIPLPATPIPPLPHGRPIGATPPPAPSSSPPPAQAGRRERIERAAYELLCEVGYRSASILAIAKRARASNDTLYQWYGNKAGVFAALVARNAAEARSLLDAVDDGQSALQVLRALGPVLLRVVTGESAVRLNRAAGADLDEGGGQLGEALARHGREALRPRLAALMLRLGTEGRIVCADPRTAEDCSERYLALLLGDWQIRRAIGVMAEPDVATCEARARWALDGFLGLHGRPPPGQPAAAPASDPPTSAAAIGAPSPTPAPAATAAPTTAESLLDAPLPPPPSKPGRKGKGKGGKNKKARHAKRQTPPEDDARSDPPPSDAFWS